MQINSISYFKFSYFVLFLLICDANSTDDFLNLDSIILKTSKEIQTQAAKDVICRTIPKKCDFFIVHVNPGLSQNGKDVFSLIKENDQIAIHGSSGVACTWGFHYYLKNYCNCHIGWQTRQLKLPDILPDVNITVTAKDRLRYYQNVCTTSYSFVWWDMEKWRHHIDWMALNGMNIALASHGQEAIWQRVYRKLQLTQNEIDHHFSGPAFLSWQRMGNIRGWGGPLSKFWHLHSLQLEHFVVEAMVNLSIVPVLPAFAGHVPKAFKRLFPNASLKTVEPWNEFNDDYCCSLYLDPNDPLFNYVGKLFLTEMTEEFGMYHVYNSDPFNEMSPSSKDLNFLKAVGLSIYKSMSDVDPNAIWLLQGWMFLHDILYWTQDRAKALLTSVDKGKILILDLQSEQWPQYNRYSMYFGQPFIWCMLHNFGGTLGMFGDSQSINTEVYNARLAPNSSMVGTGLTPEGINQNYVMYDLMLESALRDSPVSINEWITSYTIRRYGLANDDIINAWKLLMKSVYNFKGLEKMRGKYVISRRPSLTIKPWTWYHGSDLFEAWRLFLNATAMLQTSECYRHDLTDITRQVLQYKADQIYPLIIDDFYNKRLESLEQCSTKLMNLFEDLEAILSSNKGFLLGNWLETAKSLAYDDEDKRLFEFNARNQITLWGPYGEIVDYANKQWAGVVSDFFALRWKLYLSAMYDSVKNNNKFNATALKNKIFSTIERPFTFSIKSYPQYEIGNTTLIAKEIFEKWYCDDNYPDIPLKSLLRPSQISEVNYENIVHRSIRDDNSNEDNNFLYDVVLVK